MQFDFTTLIDRHGRDAIAVDPPEQSVYRSGYEPMPGFDHIPMWVADMSFATAPSIPRAMQERASHPLYGYYEPTQAYFDAICRWQAERNGVLDLQKEHIGYENGVLGGVASALRAIASPGDAVLLHSPCYIGFTHVLDDCGYRGVHSALIKDKSGIWRMDYADMEAKIRKHHIHAAIFCSPHNPSGRVWERWEIEKAMELFARNQVTVISDEIWSDLTLFGNQHIPTQSVSKDAKMRTIAFYAPSKTFNLAGLIGSYHIIYDPLLRDRVRKAGSSTFYNHMNVLSMHALIGAYSEEGSAWLCELRKVLGENIRYACDFIKEHFPDVHVNLPQGTYLLYLDCSDWCARTGKSLDELLRLGYSVGVDWQDGRPFLKEHTIRMNLAIPNSLVKEAFDRLAKYVFTM